MNWMPRRAAQAAASLRKEPRGSAVLQSLSRPASVGALSDADGRVKDHCLAEQVRCASMASASCASVSKQAM